ncbi:hypothetical protein ACVILI_003118 [Mesorhizobium sp. USDA 4775]
MTDLLLTNYVARMLDLSHWRTVIKDQANALAWPKVIGDKVRRSSSANRQIQARA